MTVRSSWWQSTSERGGGLVCWLESLRALIASPPLCDVIFTANSGHELPSMGRLSPSGSSLKSTRPAVPQIPVPISNTRRERGVGCRWKVRRTLGKAVQFGLNGAEASFVNTRTVWATNLISQKMVTPGLFGR